MTNQSFRNDEQEQLDWLAFQYVAGELSIADATAFEDRLASDFTACEAVARAVELSDALHTAHPTNPQSVVLPVRAEFASATWSLVGIAAAMLIVGSLWMRQGRPSNWSGEVLAQRWSKQLAESPLELTVDEIAADDATQSEMQPSEASSNDQPGDDELLIGADADVPAWMLDGVRGLYDQDAHPSAAQIEELES